MRKKKINNKKLKNKKKIRLNPDKPVRKRWIAKRKTFSNLPYVITVSHFRRNIFFTAANLRGQTKLWINSGRCGFKGRNKVNKMAVLTLAKFFFQKVRDYGIKYAIFKFKNFSRNRWQVRNALKDLKKIKKKRRLKFLAFLIENQTSFNGCRAKKKRRK